MVHLRTLLAVLIAIGVAVIYACGTTAEVGVGKDEGTGRLWFGANATWGVSGPVNMCGCLTWTDQERQAAREDRVPHPNLAHWAEGQAIATGKGGGMRYAMA